MAKQRSFGEKYPFSDSLLPIFLKFKGNHKNGQGNQHDARN